MDLRFESFTTSGFGLYGLGLNDLRPQNNSESLGLGVQGLGFRAQAVSGFRVRGVSGFEAGLNVLLISLNPKS